MYELYLAPHGQSEEDEEVHNENGPVDGYVERFEEGTKDGDGGCTRGG